MQLAKIWCAWIAAREVAMANIWSCMRIAFDAMVRDEFDCIATSLAEAVSGVARDRRNCDFQRKYPHHNPR